MAVPSYAEVRRMLREAGAPLDHPTKMFDPSHPRLANTPHPYGRIVYFEGGAVGGLFGEQYLIAEGEDHEDSAYGLAQHLGLSKVHLDGVTVSEVDREAFYRRVRG